MYYIYISCVLYIYMLCMIYIYMYIYIYILCIIYLSIYIYMYCVSINILCILCYIYIVYYTYYLLYTYIYIIYIYDMCVYFQLGSHKRLHLVTWSPRLVIDVLFQDLLSPPAAGKSWESLLDIYMAVCQNLVPLVNIKIAGK